MTNLLFIAPVWLVGSAIHLPFSSTAAADEPLPPAAVGILRQLDKEVDIAKAKALVGLEKVLKETTKKGDLAGALAVKEAIEGLRPDTRGAVGGRSAPNRANASAIVGQWNEGSGVVTVLPDGSVRTAGDLTGQWTSDGSGFEVKWSNGAVYKLRVEADGLVGPSVTASGQPSCTIRWTRAK